MRRHTPNGIAEYDNVTMNIRARKIDIVPGLAEVAHKSQNSVAGGAAARHFVWLSRYLRRWLGTSSHRRVRQFEIWNPVVCQCRGCAVIATVRKLLRRVTIKNGVNTNVRTASRELGGVMVSVGFGSAFFGGNVPLQAKSTLSSRNTLK